MEDERNKDKKVNICAEKVRKKMKETDGRQSPRIVRKKVRGCRGWPDVS